MTDKPKQTQSAMKHSATAMILAAGFGTRMRPLTLTTPKPLLKVGGVPLIVWHILAIKAAGIRRIVINTAWLADKLMDALGDGSQFGVQIVWSREEEALETAGGIRQALGLLAEAGDAPFLLVNGDVWTTTSYTQVLVQAARAQKSAFLCLVDNPEHNPTGDFLLSPRGVSAKQEAADMGLTFAGVSVLDPKLFTGLPLGEKAPLAPILRGAMRQGDCAGLHLSERVSWVDVGTPERLAALDADITHKAAANNHPAYAELTASGLLL